ncbi:MAG: hypothetical protein AB1611_00900 [bacterium]
MNDIRTGRSAFFNQGMRVLIMIMGALIIQAVCIFNSSGDFVSRAEGADSGSWEIQSPQMNANWLNDIWATSDSNVFAVGFGMNGAVIGHYDGQSWKTMEAYLLEEQAAELTGIWGSSAQDIFAVGGTTGQEDGQTLIYHYNGAAWSIMNAPFSGCLLDVWGSGPGDVFAVGIAGLVLHWNGISWTEMSLSQAIGAADPLPDLQSVWGNGPDNVFAVGIYLDAGTQQPVSTILHYQNGHWTLMLEIPSVCLYDIWGAPGGDIWAAGDRIFRYRNSVWQDVTPDDLQEFCLNKIAGRSASDFIAVGIADLAGEKGVILRCDGQTWRHAEGLVAPGYLCSAWVGQDGKILVVGGNFLYDYPSLGIVLAYDGTSWSSQSARAYEGTCLQVWAANSQNAFVVGGHPSPMTEEMARVFIARYDGHTWTPLDVPEQGVLFDIWGSAGQELFAVGGNWWKDDNDQTITESLILHSTNGTDWTRMPDSPGIEDILEGVWGSSSSDVYAVGNSIYHYNGSGWSKMSSPPAGRLRGIWGCDSLNVFAVGDWSEIGGQRATILRYNGQTWSAMSHNIQDNLFRVWCSSPSHVFAVGENHIYHYNGTGWSTMDCPAVSGYYDIWGTSANDVYATYDVATERQSANGSTGVYYQCGILHYNGQSWQDEGFLPACGPLFGIGGTSARNLFVAGELGTILHRETQGPASMQKIPLRQGWNLISFQVNVCMHSQQQPPSDIFFPPGIEFRRTGDLCTWLSDRTNSPIRDAADPTQAGDWQRITSFDNRAHLLDKSAPAIFNNLTYISAGYGYWIKMNKPGYLVLTGTPLPSSASLPLQKGWNLVGAVSPDSCYYQGAVPPCPLQETPSVNFIPVAGPVIPELFSSITGKYLRVTSFDCKGGKVYDPYADPIFCNLKYFAPGCGYWIKMSEEAYLTLP